MKKFRLFGGLLLWCVAQVALAQSIHFGLPSKKAPAAAAPADKPHQGVTSPMHQKYMGKIVFASSDAPIALQNESEAGFKSDFVLGQPLFWRVYMGNSLLNHAQKMLPREPYSILQTHARYRMNIYLNGQLAYTHHYSAKDFEDEQKEKMTTFKDAFLSPGQNFPSVAAFRAFLAKNDAQLGNGSHKVRVDLLPYLDYPSEAVGSVVASGEFELKVNSSSVAANDAEMCLPKAAMTDAPLESAILAAFKVKASQEQWKEQARLTRITSSRWTVVKHRRTGNTIKRSLEAVVASSLPGGKCIYQTFGFSQDAMGSSFQGDVYMDGVGPQEDISCKCLK
jgi:hypothetical protein